MFTYQPLCLWAGAESLFDLPDHFAGVKANDPGNADELNNIKPSLATLIF